MQDDSWIAAVTLGGQEYNAKIELERLGLHPYLPQLKKTWRPRGALKPMVRAEPLFPRYIFLPLSEGRVREIHYARYLKKPKALLSDAEGRLWKVPADNIFEIAEIENRDGFNEFLVVGDRLTMRQPGSLSAVEILLARTSKRTIEVFMPLFGGCRGIAAPETLRKAG